MEGYSIPLYSSCLANERLRHRYTASYITVLLDSSFESPHTLLGNYIEKISNYIPHDNSEYTHGEVVRFNRWYTSIGDSGLKEGMRGRVIAYFLANL